MHSPILVDGPISQSLVPGPMPSPQAQNKPALTSFDSGQEFSLSHHLEIHLLVDSEDRELTGYVFDEECLEVF